MGKVKDITGLKSGKLEAIELSHIDKYGAVWKCRCECGNVINVRSSSVVNGHSKSCGCLWTESMHKVHTKHGMCESRIYDIWRNMKARCDSSMSQSYRLYGGRGIKYQESWGEFINFKNDMYESYLTHIETHGETNTSIDGQDVNGNYTKENCNWKTNIEQSNNKRNNRYLEYNGETMSLTETARKYNLKDYQLYKRLKLGWSLEKALTTPIKI